ncbi:succinate dehydrogenase, hydrophobic membrane anchor protein [Rhodospirillaceae bacterium KN72]|uniref:Succinate dehydrogenase hydrophobic membrane anchor subunit n=1 Tax=Pacificispira spongiicola TaxID=2729598 RepID=A0A7Y0E1K1_9PROT|nr:succinate dehydrogenase, hydrophobic membrane anchor protein [Pacificispira spongiicola]NMM45559.1 succinate dehydrogenase, hydrophobic membrane anchor protein [Pacificispira spongiicola]
MLKSPLGQVRGLGSAKNGTHHWWAQRVTAVALVPLTLWFVFSLAFNVGGDFVAMQAWLATPSNAILMLLLIVATFHHLHLGVQVVIEDYIHAEGAKIAMMMVVKLGSFALAVAAGFAVLKVAFAA